VRERPQPGWEPVSKRLGAFELYPEVAVGVGATSNVKKAETDEQGDRYVRLRPGARLFSTWSRHGVGLAAWTAHTRYDRSSEDNATEYLVSGAGRLDIQRDLWLDGRLSRARLVTSRTDPDVPVDTLEPVYNEQSLASLSLFKTTARMQFAAAVTAQSDDYGVVARAGGARADFNRRDRDYFSYGGRATYALSPDFAAFAAVLRETSERPNAVGDRLDYDNVSLLGGANFDLTNLARGEIGVGYLRQTYEAAGLGSDSGFAWNAEFQWFPSQLTTVSFNAARRSAPQLDESSPGGISTSAGVTIDHELLRNVIVSGRLSRGDVDFALIDRKDEQTRAGVSVGYRMNRRLRADLAFDYSKLDSTGANRKRSFDDRTVTFTVYAYP